MADAVEVVMMYHGALLVGVDELGLLLHEGEVVLQPVLGTNLHLELGFQQPDPRVQGVDAHTRRHARNQRTELELHLRPRSNLSTMATDFGKPEPATTCVVAKFLSQNGYGDTNTHKHTRSHTHTQRHTHERADKVQREVGLRRLAVPRSLSPGRQPAAPP